MILLDDERVALNELRVMIVASSRFFATWSFPRTANYANTGTVNCLPRQPFLFSYFSTGLFAAGSFSTCLRCSWNRGTLSSHDRENKIFKIYIYIYIWEIVDNFGFLFMHLFKSNKILGMFMKIGKKFFNLIQLILISNIFFLYFCIY